MTDSSQLDHSPVPAEGVEPQTRTLADGSTKTASNCANAKDFSGVTHLCVKPLGHDGAHTSGSASWGAHDWADKHDPRMTRWPSLLASTPEGMKMCLTCGVIQRRDGKNSPCKGPARITLRRLPAAQSAAHPGVPAGETASCLVCGQVKPFTIHARGIGLCRECHRGAELATTAGETTQQKIEHVCESAHRPLCPSPKTCREVCEDVDGLSYCLRCGMWEGNRQSAAHRPQEAPEEVPTLAVTRQAILDMLVKHGVLGAREALDRLIVAARQQPSAAHRAEVESDVEEAKKHALCSHNRGGFRVSPTQMQCADCRFVYEQDGKVQEQAINTLIRVVRQQAEAEVERLTKAQDAIKQEGR